MVLSEAQKIADKYVKILQPYCRRIEVAGSVRRQKPEVKDIEIVCIRNTAKMFDFVRVINSLEKIKGDPAGKYTQRRLPEGINLDLFMCIKENWGLIFAIRTGSAEFSHKVLGNGWVRAGYKCVDGMLYQGGYPYSIYEEAELFNLIGLNYIEPEKRI